MLAESIHSMADTGNQALLLWGSRAGKRQADDSRQFGYGRERFFWAFVVSLVLFSLGSVFAIYEGIHKLQHPTEIDSPMVAIVIIAVAVVLESFALRLAIVESRKLADGKSLWEFIRTTKTPELPVVLLEDTGAMLGLLVAFVALLLGWQVDPIFDGVGTVVIGVLLGVIAVVLAWETKSLLIGESASQDHQATIEGAITETEGVERVIHMRTEHLGPDRILVAAKIALADDLEVAEVAAAIDESEARLRQRIPTARYVYLEPDLYRDGSSQ